MSKDLLLEQGDFVTMSGFSGAVRVNSIADTYGLTIRSYDADEEMWTEKHIALRDREQVEAIRDAFNRFLEADKR